MAVSRANAGAARDVADKARREAIRLRRATSDGDRGGVTVSGGGYTLDVVPVPFTTIRVATQDDVEAAANQVLTLAAGSGIGITTNAATGVATIASSLLGVTDGDKGDVVVSSSGSAWNLDSGVCTAAGRALIDDADASAQRTTLGFAVEIPNAVLVTDSTGAMAWLDASAATNGDVLTKRDSADPQFEFAAPGGGGGGSFTTGTATIDFGSFPGTSEASIAVTGQGSIVAGSQVSVWIGSASTSGGHTASDHRYAAAMLGFSISAIDVGVGFTIHARCLDAMQGSFLLSWRWS